MVTENVLTFRKLNIIKAPGFMASGFEVEELKPQLNIVYGPNAAGKTTMARVLSYLIWPEAAPANLTVRGKFTVNEDSWFAAIDAGNVTYQKNGAESTRPLFPPSENRDRYYIALHELLQQETGDKSLAEIIIRESAGGYQIAEAEAELGFKDKPSRTGKTTRIARNKIKDYQKAVNRQEELADEERQLKQLQQELTDIKQAEDRLAVLTQVLVYVRSRAEYQELRTELEQFPGAVSRLEGSEDEQVQELEQSIADYINKKRNAEEKYEKAEQQLEAIDLPDRGISEKKLRTIKVKRDKLTSLAEKKEQFQYDLKEARTRAEEEQKNFKDLVDSKSEKLAEIDGVSYNQLSDFARRAQEIKSRLSSFKSLKELLQLQDNNNEEEASVQKGVCCLQTWLESPEESIWRKTKQLTLIASIIIFLMILYLGYTVNPLLFVLTAVPAGIFWYGRELTGSRYQYKKEAREEFGRLSLSPPSAWNKSVVKTRLQELYDHLVEIKLTQRRRQYWQHRNKEYVELKEKQEELNRERLELINRFGVAPDTEEETLYYLTNRLSRWQDAYCRIQSLKGKLNEVNKNYQKVVRELTEMLTDYGYTKIEDAAEISGQIAELESRNNQFREAVRDKREAHNSIKAAEEKLQQARKSRQKIYEKAGLEAGNSIGLRDLCDLYDEYKELKESLNSLEFHKQREREKLEQYPEFKQTMLDKNQRQLEKELLELENKVDKSPEIQKKITSIETKIKTARQGRDVEKALADKERALEQLQTELYGDYEKLTGKVLADYVRQVNTVHNRPRVFQKGRQLFNTITRGNYELEINNETPPSFRAIETASARGKSLDQLSSGTRIQLLLAVRMAFIDEEESGMSLPLFLDETLANTDDIKAEAIIKSISELTRKGRQCFYFTAQKDEVNKWLSLAGENSDIGVNLIDLTAEKQLSQIKANSDLYSDISLQAESIKPDIGEIAAADGLSHEEYYQQLSLPPFNPRQGAGSIHLWYVIEDPELIEHLLYLGIERWGQLQTLLATGKENVIPEGKQEQLPEIQQLGCWLEEFVDCWQTGRGQSVDRSALMDSGAVSNNFIDEVTELAENADGDAETIIEELRGGAVSRFLSKKIDELEQYFQEEGYISSREPLSGEEIYARMLSVVNMDNPEQIRKKLRRLMERITQGSITQIGCAPSENS